MTTDTARTTGPAARSGRTRVDRGAAASGAVTSFVAVVLVATARSVLSHAVPRFDDSAWLGLLSLVVVVGFGAGGVVAARRCGPGTGGRTALVTGMVAAATAVVAWVPVRALIWVVRDEPRDLLGGRDPALPVGPLVANLVVAAAAGAVGAWLSTRRAGGPTTDA